MNEPLDGHAKQPATGTERLDSWKEIAAYLGRGVTTVQRWEQFEGLPVHRLPHAKKGSVFALKSELDAWRSARVQLGATVRQSAPDEDDPLVDPVEVVRRALVTGSRRVRWVILGTVAGIAAVALVLTQVFRTTSTAATVGRADPVIPRPIANDVAEEGCPTLSPDGRQLVYYWSRESAPGLFIKPVSGGPPQPLSTADVPVFECGYPKWSPKGDLIAFLGRAEGDAKVLWVMSPGGGQPRRLTSMSGIGLAWAPDGETLAFVDRNSPGEPFSIFSVPLRGGARRRLTTPALGDFGDTFAAFSPDGRRMAIVRYGARYQSDAFIVPTDTLHHGTLDRLTMAFSGIEGVDWSPDGRTVVLGSHHGLWKVDVDGDRRRTRVAAFDGGAKYPTFSRLGANGTAIRLVYQSDIIDVNVWRWDIERREARKVAGSSVWDDFPAFAPAGDRIAFASNRTGANEIWIANADGTSPHQLTFHTGPVVVSPQWSPDGTRLVFSSQVGENRDIYVSRSDGSESTRLTTAPSEDGNPSWSRDGRSIYFRSDQAGVGQIWKVPLIGGSPVRITTGEALEAYESPDGKLLYFVRTGDTGGLWSVPVTGGQEAPVVAGVRAGYWGVADTGVYFLQLGAEGTSDPVALRFFDFATRAVSTIADSLAPTRTVHNGFAVSRDGRFVLWTQRDNAIRDLMLIDPWRP